MYDQWNLKITFDTDIYLLNICELYAMIMNKKISIILTGMKYFWQILKNFHPVIIFLFKIIDNNYSATLDDKKWQKLWLFLLVA